MESDTQPDTEEVTSANTEINNLTDSLEVQPTADTEPIKDVQTFWTRLDSLISHLEVPGYQKKDKLHSFTNQPERVCISSDNDINTSQTQDALNEQNFDSFRVAIARPFLDVKSIQRLRASIPNAVTNIPDQECVFWYYRIPTATFSGTISITGTNGYSNATFTAGENTITPALSTAGIFGVLDGIPSAGFVTYQTSPLTGLVAGTEVVITGITPAGYSGTFNISAVNPPNAFTVVNATIGAETITSAAWTVNIDDIIRWDTVPYSVCNAAGVPIGYFNAPQTDPGSSSIFTSDTLTGPTIGTITRSGGLFMPSPSYQYLHMIRLLPSTYKTELFDVGSGQNTNLPGFGSTYGYNRTFADYKDLAIELAKSCTADPAYDSSIDDGDSFPLFIPADISITFNQTLNKFIFTGNNAFLTISSIEYQFATYLSAGFQDPILWNTALANTNDSIWFLKPISAPQLFTYTASPGNSDFNFIYGAGGQPYQLYRTLNLRLGFTWNGLTTQIAQYFPVNMSGIQGIVSSPTVLTSYLNRLRPVPEYIDQPVPLLSAATSPYIVEYYTADSYANLVYTNTVSLYADFTGGSTYDSMANTQLLACVPMNASNLGVTFYNTTLYCPLTKIADQIYEIEIRMLTDTGAPFVVPNSSIISLEFALTY